MNSDHTIIDAFAIKDCALVAIATGKRAQNLKELYEYLQIIHPESIYYHFWGEMLRPRFVDPEYNNDFSSWAHHGLHDTRLAERLGVIDPTDFKDLESLRRELLDVIEERLDEFEHIPWSKKDRQFHFIRSQIVVFNTQQTIEAPEQLPKKFPGISTSSIFYHFVDARRRNEEGYNDFNAWLGGFGEKYSALCVRLSEIDPYFTSLVDLRKELSRIFIEYFGKGQV